jgi:hypothetical protein
MKNVFEFAICAIAVLVLLSPAIGLADTVPAGVDPEQIANIVEQVAKSIGHLDSPHDAERLALMIPILGILGIFFAPMVVVIVVVRLAYRYRENKEQRNHETIRQMIEKGMEIPPNISFGDAPETTASPLSRGLKLVGIGLGLGVFFAVMGMGGLIGIGAIPLFIGLAYVLIWFLEKNKTGTGKAG